MDAYQFYIKFLKITVKPQIVLISKDSKDKKKKKIQDMV